MSKRHLLEALQALQKAFIINKKVKRDAYWKEGRYTRVCYGFRDHGYELKEHLIAKAILIIRKYQLPIKYGYGIDSDIRVIYFEYRDRQLSFHDPYNVNKCKKFPGKWNGVHAKRCPFAGVITRLEKSCEPPRRRRNFLH